MPRFFCHSKPIHPSFKRSGFQYLCTSKVGADHVAATKATGGTGFSGRRIVYRSLEKCGRVCGVQILWWLLHNQQTDRQTSKQTNKQTKNEKGDLEKRFPFKESRGTFITSCHVSLKCSGLKAWCSGWLLNHSVETARLPPSPIIMEVEYPLNERKLLWGDVPMLSLSKG